MSCTVIRNVVLFTIDEQDRVYRDGTVVVRGDHIAAVGPSDQVGIPADASRVIEGGHKMALIPGLIDTHSHSSLLRGVTENYQLLDWLPRYQLEHRALTEADAYYAALLSYLEALKGGSPVSWICTALCTAVQRLPEIWVYESIWCPTLLMPLAKTFLKQWKVRAN
jgi:5-methylthioadenosine/S-adenosylhomocysteine deaminase